MTRVRFIKAQGPTQTKEEEEVLKTALGNDVISPPYPLKELKKLSEESTILAQCVTAYKRNIVGFGANVKYEEDDNQKQETSEMKAEWNAVKDWVKYFNFDQSFEDVLAAAVEDREYCGNGYIEIIRDGTGLPEGGEHVEGTTIRISKLTEAVKLDIKRNGKTFPRWKQFRRYVQVINGVKKVWFKEFGDPRMMNKETGEFEDGLAEEMQANELIHLKIGTGTYGIPRWIGQLIHMYGARKAEELNFRYFTQGRHTPMAILLHNAKLSEESMNALEDYATSIEGVDNAHKFLIIEAEGEEEGILADEKKQAKVEVKSLAEMLQNDALFLEYDDASREKVQSAFGLPDIYVGRSKDFNRATADMARQITEEQVFDPERNSLEWIINNKLLVDRGLKFVQVFFNKPEIGDSADLANMIKTLGELGAYAPNDLREMAGKVINKELEPFDGDEFDKPAKGAAVAPPEGEQSQGQGKAKAPAKNGQAGQSSTKVVKAHETFVEVLKDVRDAIEELKEGQPN